MIPNAPTDVDIRALTVIEQLSRLADRAGWSDVQHGTDIAPVLTLLDADYEVIKHQVIETPGKPAEWLPRWAAIYGALIDLAEHLALTVEGTSQIVDMERLAQDLHGDGSECPIESEHGSEPCSWCGRRLVDQENPSAYFVSEGQVRLIHLFSKDMPTLTLIKTREPETYRWIGDEGQSVDETITMFERLMVGALDVEGGEYP